MNAPHPDTAAMLAHASHLFSGLPKDKQSSLIELAWADTRSGDLRHAQHFAIDELGKLVEYAARLNTVPGQNVYIGAALRKPDTAHNRRASDTDFCALTALYADFDEPGNLGSAELMSDLTGISATARVITGRHPHQRGQLWWLLNVPQEDPGNCRRLNNALATALRGDVSVVNPGRVMRLGGSIAWPKKQGRIVELTSFERLASKRYAAYDVEKAFPTLHDAPEKPLATSVVQRNVTAPLVIDTMRNVSLTSLGGSMRRRGMDAAEIAPALKAVNAKRCSPPLPESEVEGIARSVERYAPASSEIIPAETTEDRLALEFSSRNSEDWRYVATWGQWYQWNGTCWRAESTLRAYDLARNVCREVAARSDKPNISARVASAATVAAVERLAKADRKHAATTEQWDTQRWFLNTPGGVVYLKTGEVKPHDREDYLTKITTASPGTGCPSWTKFLKDISDGDTDLQAYLARIVGYALTGETNEHTLFFLYGTGANGKSVFLNTLEAVLGDYAKTAAADTFLESKTDRHPTDMAMLRGARMVISNEVDQGRRWAEAKLKSLTGGDSIAARFMRQDFFEFTPQFKLFVAGNHKPSIRGVDEAMRRRLHLVPFTVTIPAEKRDKGLPERLLAERDGILGWAIEGCLDWQRVGLQAPKAVLGATQDYFAAEDALGRWIAESCRQGPNETETTNALFTAWTAWATASGEFIGSEKRLATELEARGFSKWQEPRTRRRGFQGLSLLPAETDFSQIRDLL